MTSRVVFGVGVPHVPVFPAAARDGDAAVAARYAAASEAMAATGPTLLILLATDHLNTFFLNWMPTFAIGTGVARGPVDDVPGVPIHQLPGEPAAAAALAAELIDRGFDLTVCRDMAADHSVCVPLHFLNPTGLAVIVINMNGYCPPLPTATRCHQLGIAIGQAVGALPRDHRVAVIASGSFSQEVGGPRLDPGRTWSVPKPDWVTSISARLAADDIEGVLVEATPSTLAQAGSVAGELLSWIAMVGAAGPAGAGLRPRLDHRPGEAFAFGTWSGS